MSHPEIITEVLSVLSATINCTLNEDSSRKNTPQWDSLKHIEVIFALEDELNVHFSEDAIGNLDSVAKIVAAVESLHAA